MMLPRLLPIALCLLLMVGCVDSPTAPTGLGGGAVPDVAGTYSGTITLTITGSRRPMRGTSTLVVTVAQSGNEVTLSGTQRWPGESPILIWDGVRGTIDSLGIFSGPALRDSTDPECGRVRYRSRRLAVLRRHPQLRLGGGHGPVRSVRVPRHPHAPLTIAKDC